MTKMTKKPRGERRAITPAMTKKPRGGAEPYLACPIPILPAFIQSRARRPPSRLLGHLGRLGNIERIAPISVHPYTLDRVVLFPEDVSDVYQEPRSREGGAEPYLNEWIRMGHDTNRARRPPLGFLVIFVFLGSQVYIYDCIRLASPPNSSTPTCVSDVYQEPRTRPRPNHIRISCYHLLDRDSPPLP